jgi:hypothetical protein
MKQALSPVQIGAILGVVIIAVAAVGWFLMKDQVAGGGKPIEVEAWRPPAGWSSSGAEGTAPPGGDSRNEARK